MPNYTPNLNLEKPLQTETYNIDVHNANSDKIDEASQTHRTALVLDHPDESVTTKKIAPKAVTTEKMADSGATPGTYRSVTVDRTGRVMQGSNPSRLGDYGITDAYTKTESDNRFVNVTKTFVGATSNKNGESGLVPAPAQGAGKMFLSAQGGWSALPDIPTNVSSFANDAKYVGVYDEGDGYIRYVSGLMVCTTHAASPYGQAITWTYPMPFADTPIVVLGAEGGTESTVRLDKVTTTYCVHHRHYSGSGKGNGNVNIVARGRWR